MIILSAILETIPSESSKEKFERFYYKYKKYALKVANAYLDDAQDIEDAVQDAFFKISKHIDAIDVDDSSKTRGYLRVTVCNCCIDVIKSKRSLDSVQLDEERVPDEASYNPEDILVCRELDSKLANAIDELSKQEYMILYYNLVMQLSLADIARALSQSHNTVKSIKRRSIAKIAKILKELSEDA